MLASEGGACCVDGPEVCDRPASSEAKEEVYLLPVVCLLQMHRLHSLHHSWHRWLVARTWVVDKAEHSLQEHAAWRLEFQNNSVREVGKWTGCGLTGMPCIGSSGPPPPWSAPDSMCTFHVQDTIEGEMAQDKVFVQGCDVDVSSCLSSPVCICSPAGCQCAAE
jgi:hypothetical protein